MNEARKLISDFLGFLKYKVDHDGFTLEEELFFKKLFESCIPLSATAEDLANYYDKTPEAVRSVISRKMLSKPKRRVLHNFNEFRQVVPKKWKK